MADKNKNYGMLLPHVLAGDLDNLRNLIQEDLIDVDEAMDELRKISIPSDDSFDCQIVGTIQTDVINIYELLLDNGADCNATDTYGNTPFFHALATRNMKIIRMLLDHGAYISPILSHFGMTALHFAAKNSQNPDVLEFLLDRGLDIERTDYGGSSALHQAAEYENAAGCELLLKRGANIARADSEGQTPLILAISSFSQTSRKKPTVEILVEYGASIADRAGGKSVLGIAAENDRCKSVRGCLVEHMAQMQYSQSDLINNGDRQIIENKKCYREYFQECMQELEKMKNTKFYNNVCILNILIGSKKVISAYARNHELLEALEEKNYAEMFPVYYARLQKRFYIEVDKQKSLSNAANILSNIFKFIDPSNQVVQQILIYFKDEDLKLLDM